METIWLVYHEHDDDYHDTVVAVATTLEKGQELALQHAAMLNSYDPELWSIGPWAPLANGHPGVVAERHYTPDGCSYARYYVVPRSLNTLPN